MTENGTKILNKLCIKSLTIQTTPLPDIPNRNHLPPPRTVLLHGRINNILDKLGIQLLKGKSDRKQTGAR